jgi:hypothetical protein
MEKVTNDIVVPLFKAVTNDIVVPLFKAMAKRKY